MELKDRQRAFLGAFFFFSGVVFSSWASRIPTIKDQFGLNDAELGTVLLFMPISSLVGLPVSGWLVSRYDSRIPLAGGFTVMSLALILIGYSQSTFILIPAICVFSFSMRIFNIAVNTQAITLQKQFDRKINGAFHGLWSTGGIAGVGFSTLMVGLKIGMAVHLLIIACAALLCAFIAHKHLIRNDRAPAGNKLQLGKPDLYIVYLGLMVFLAAVCEGGMFDWSGIYFKEVVNVEIFTLGYLTFMIFMAISRFASDQLIEKIGMPNTYIFSSLLVMTGISLAVIFPFFWSSLFGFCLVGFGAAAVIPMTYLLAGSSRKYSAGMAISIIATYAIMGMLVGPPLIGYISHALNLRVAFVAFGLAGFGLIPISRLFFAYNRSQLEADSAS
jgi:MFS family permease